VHRVLSQLALGFCRSRPFMGSTIVGATSLEQLKENIETFEMEALTPDVLEAIDEIYSEYRDPAN
jgi:aryl-alcohol dehydrogenase (NADP+)